MSRPETLRSHPPRQAGRRALALLATLAALAAAGCPKGGGDDGTGEQDAWSGPTYLREVTDDVGVDFQHEVVLSGEYALPEIMGAGCAVLDADGDGLLDLYFTNAGTNDREGAANRLFLRTPGGRYEDATERSGLGDRGYGFGVGTGDFDNDGDVDVYVGNWGADRLYRNDGDGTFTDVTEQAGITGDQLTTSIAFLDQDLDGLLDIYVVRYVAVDPTRHCSGNDSRREYCGPGSFEGVADTLYRNRGDGTFEDVSSAVGIAGTRGPGLGVYVADFDDDGRPDVFVANDGDANQLWINQPDGTFRDDALLWGVAFNAQGASEASMGVAFGDVDGDGQDDLFLTHLGGETNTLYLRHGRSAFRDASQRAGMDAASLSRTGFGTAFLDVDHDGALDIAIVNGSVIRGDEMPGDHLADAWRRYAQPNQLLLGDGDGAFTDVSPGTGTYAALPEVSRGLAHGDLDGDGDLDLIVNNNGGRARVYENVAPKSGHWVSVRAIDPALKRDAYGARVTLRLRDGLRTAIVGTASSYLSASAPSVHFGLPQGAQVVEAEVRWPGGQRERFDVPGVDQAFELRRGEGRK